MTHLLDLGGLGPGLGLSIASASLCPLGMQMHGWGMFADEAIEAGQFLIEYIGEMTRASLADIRERRYEADNHGDYMFR